MKDLKKIFFLWIGIFALYSLAIRIFAHVDSPISTLVNQANQVALFLICLYIIRREPNRTNTFIFINFALYFSLTFASMLYPFAGKAFLIGKYSRFLFSQYLWITYVILLTFSVVYIVIDLIFRNARVLQKYAVAIAIVGSFSAYYLNDYFRDPYYLESTQDIKQWITLNSFIEKNGGFTSTAELANKVTLQTWRDGKPVGDLYPEENYKQIQELLPYLERDNWRILEYRPLYKSTIFMDVAIIFFLLLFFGYQYKSDPPQGAYIDKIMFLILFYVSLDILHNWGFIKSVEWGSFFEIFSIGQYVTVTAEFLMVLFFALRLRFIVSAQGQYYETELAANPRGISRWRDWVDDAVLFRFFNFRLFNGRLFQNPTGK